MGSWAVAFRAFCLLEFRAYFTTNLFRYDDLKKRLMIFLFACSKYVESVNKVKILDGSSELTLLSSSQNLSPEFIFYPCPLLTVPIILD